MINRNFTFLWAGKIISQLGDKFYALALAWWILQKTDSPAVMGLFLLVSVLPGLLFGFFAGALADRLKRKNLIIVSDIVRGALVFAISYLSMVGIIEVWHVFLTGSCLSLTAAFFDPAMQSIIPEIVEKEDLTKANGISQTVDGVCTVAGPLLGAVAISALGMTWVFFANSVSFFVSAFLAFFIKTNRACSSSAEKTNILSEVREGFSFIRGQSRITLVLQVIAIAHLFVGGLTVSLPFLARALEGSGVNNLGYLEMTLGAGLFAGAAFMSVKKKANINERILVSLMMALGFCFIIISVSQLLKVEAVYAYMPIMIIIGACISCASVFWISLLQRYTPGNMTGRVFSVSTLIGNTSLPVAYGIFGILLNHSSILNLMAVCGAGLTAFCFYLFLRNKYNKEGVQKQE